MNVESESEERDKAHRVQSLSLMNIHFLSDYFLFETYIYSLQ